LGQNLKQRIKKWWQKNCCRKYGQKRRRRRNLSVSDYHKQIDLYLKRPQVDPNQQNSHTFLLCYFILLFYASNEALIFQTLIACVITI
jgi:hypothetical protein